MDDNVFVVVVSTMNFCVPQDNRASGWVCIVGFSGEKHEQAFVSIRLLLLVKLLIPNFYFVGL